MNATTQFLKKDSTVVVILFLTLSAGFLSLAIQNILLVAFCILAPISKSFDYKRVDFKVFLILGIPFFIGIISAFFSENTSYAYDLALRRFPLIILGFFILAIKIREKDFIFGFKLFTSVSVIASLFMFAKGAVLYFQIGVFFHPNFAVHFVPIHHPYFGSYILISLMFLDVYYKKTSVNSTVKMSCYLILCISLFLCTARLPFLFFLLWVFYKNRAYLKQKKIKIKALIFLVTSILIISYLFMFKGLGYKYTQDFDLNKSPRLFIWKNSIELIKNNTDFPFLIGIGDYQLEINKLHRSLMKDKPGMGLIDYNSHNQYLESIIIGGPLAFVFLVYIGYLIFLSRSTNNTQLLSFTLFISLFFFFENVLQRQLGVMLLAILLPVFIKLEKPQNHINENT